jgi:hypothetical protein
MANRKISEFTALTAPASGDTFAILDVDATGSEKNKKITYANVLGKAPDGSAAAPAFSFSSDTNSGISGGSDTLVLSTGGTAAISVDSSQNVTLSANLIVNGTTTTIDSTTLTVKDKNIEIAKGNGNDAAVDGAGITIDSTEGDKTWNWVDSTDAWTSSEHIDLASGKVLKVAGTQVLSATNFTGTSAVATTVTVADESSDTSCNVLFATAATGNLAPKSGTNLTFNSDTGALTATSFVGALTGNVTGNTSGSSGSCTGNAATATALATARAINGVDFDGTAAITVTAAAGTLSGTELKSTVVTSSLTSVGTLSSLASGAITTTDNLSVDNAKEVRFYEADSNGSAYVGIKGATDKGSEASYTVSLPADAPTANQILKADASTPTNLTWATDSGGIPTSGGTFTGKVTHNYTSSLRVPAGTTGERDGSPGNGDFRYNSTNSKFEGYQGGSWGEIGGGGSGNADLLDIASSSGTGGGGATFDGSRYRFKLVTHGTSDAVTPVNAEILRVSINGVMQKPNDGSGQGDMSEGYVVSGTDIIFDSAPASGASYFIVNMGTQIAVGNATTFTVADESSDTTCFPVFTTAATGDLAPKSGSNLAFNSATGALTATSFVGSGANLTGLPAGVTINNNADNRVITGSGTANTLEGEATFTFDGTKTTTPVVTASNGIVETAATIGTNHTITSNYNAMSAGPVTVSATVTVPSGSVWTVI